MKLERIQESVPIAFTIFCGLFLALICGYLFGNEEGQKAGAIIATIMVIAFLLVVRERIWMVIPAWWMLGGKVSVLPLPFTVAQLGIALAFVMFLILKALKIVRFKPKIGILEIWMLIMLAYVGTVYLRNPVGVEALGSDRVGGKPYVDILIACAGYWVLARVVVTVRQAFWVPLLGLFGSSVHAVLNFLADRYPFLVGPMSSLYSGISAAEALADPLTPLPEASSRFAYLQGLGSGLATVACAFWRPITLLNPLRFGRFLVFMLAVVCVLLSGFRSNLIGVFELFLLSSYFRRGWGEVFRVSGLAAGAVGFLILLQGNVIDLPIPAQRALSFLPGQWEEAAKMEAQGSTEWRLDMWKAMLDGDKYIKNKWLGDGYGFTHYQLETMTANAFGGMASDAQENLLITGGVHSGPISAIRYVGYVGLAIFLTLLVLAAFRAARLIRRAQGTPYFPMALWMGLGTILLPINFVFIFGAFENDFPSTIVTIGFLRMLENSLDTYEAVSKKAAPEVIQPPKFRSRPQFAPAG
ncbi:MAG TPA: hypothetical protein VGM54_21855 [Chthoniobacter sp.]|jgi:hypothetical protein